MNWKLPLLATMAAVSLLAGDASGQGARPCGDCYDTKQPPVTIDGIITKLDLSDRFSIINVNVKNASGKTEVWRIDGPLSTYLRENDFRALRIGQRLRVTGPPYKQSAKAGLVICGATFTLSDNRSFKGAC
jgi:hypothetical protein